MKKEKDIWQTLFCQANAIDDLISFSNKKERPKNLIAHIQNNSKRPRKTKIIQRKKRSTQKPKTLKWDKPFIAKLKKMGDKEFKSSYTNRGFKSNKPSIFSLNIKSSKVSEPDLLSSNSISMEDGGFRPSYFVAKKYIVKSREKNLVHRRNEKDKTLEKTKRICFNTNEEIQNLLEKVAEKHLNFKPGKESRIEEMFEFSVLNTLRFNNQLKKYFT